MAKKQVAYFAVTLTKQNIKGSAWLAHIQVTNDGEPTAYHTEVSAWTSAGAGKRWVKERLKALTDRKSVKLIASTQNLDAKGKPLGFAGQVGFKKPLE